LEKKEKEMKYEEGRKEYLRCRKYQLFYCHTPHRFSVLTQIHTQ